MYVPKHFEETRVEVMHDLMRAHPLATLVTLSSKGLDANHIPLHLRPGGSEFGTLVGHMARGNPAWRDIDGGVDALAVFQGPHAYVSPSWYATKGESGRVVPTWNYAVVHAYGPLRVIEDRAWLRAQVEALTDRQEGRFSHPWAVSDAPPDYTERLLGAIVGVEMPISRLVGKWKASQNQPDANRTGVIEGLRKDPGTDSAAMADLMEAWTRNDG